MISIRSEPRGDAYRRFIQFLCDYCDSFSVVERRRKLRPRESARAVILRLEPFLIARSDAREWPGTTLGRGSGTALLARYRLVPETIEVLKEPEGLYDWVLPALPEDLAFYTADGTCFFGSTAHEREAMLRSARVSERHFAMRNPDIAFVWYPGER